MSMQMAKRVRLSWPWGLNRGLLEIEPLALCPQLSWGDQTHRSRRPDVGPQHSVTDIRPRVPRIQRQPPDPNGRFSAPLRLSDDWMRPTRDRTRRCQPCPRVATHDRTRRSTVVPARLVISRELLEHLNANLTRSISTD